MADTPSTSSPFSSDNTNGTSSSPSVMLPTRGAVNEVADQAPAPAPADAQFMRAVGLELGQMFPVLFWLADMEDVESMRPDGEIRWDLLRLASGAQRRAAMDKVVRNGVEFYASCHMLLPPAPDLMMSGSSPSEESSSRPPSVVLQTPMSARGRWRSDSIQSRDPPAPPSSLQFGRRSEWALEAEEGWVEDDDEDEEFDDEESVEEDEEFDDDDLVEQEGGAVGEAVEDNGPMNFGMAIKILDQFVPSPRDREDKVAKLHYWQSLCIEFRLVSFDGQNQHLPPLPTTLTAARRLLENQAHVNILDYLTDKIVDGISGRNAQADYSYLVYSSAEAMVKRARAQKRVVTLELVKDKWLQPLLRRVLEV